MRNARLLIPFVVLAAMPALAADGSPFTQTRNVAAGYIGTLDYANSRMLTECREPMAKPESWVGESVDSWRTRNGRYWRAQSDYMATQLDAARAAGGDALRDRVLNAFNGVVQKDGNGSVDRWLGKYGGATREACEKYLAMLADGSFDIRKGGLMSSSLEELADNFPRR